MHDFQNITTTRMRHVAIKLENLLLILIMILYNTCCWVTFELTCLPLLKFYLKIYPGLVKREIIFCGKTKDAENI